MSADTPDVEPTGWDRMCPDCRVIARDYVVAARVAAGRERADTRLGAVVRLGEQWVGFDDSHHYGDAVLKVVFGGEDSNDSG